MQEEVNNKLFLGLYSYYFLVRKASFVATILLINSMAAYGSDISLVIEVRDEKSIFVSSEIVKFTQDAPETGKFVGMAKNGKFEGTIACPEGTKIRAEPIDKGYMVSRKEYCRPLSPLVISVTSLLALSLLESNLESTKIVMDYGTAAFISNELTTRWFPVDSNKAEKYRVETIHLASEAMKIQVAQGKIEIKSIYDPDEWINPTVRYKNKYVMSQDFQDFLLLYQKLNNESPTGKLDFKTLKSLAGDATVYELMTKKYKPLSSPSPSASPYSSPPSSPSDPAPVIPLRKK